MAEPGCDWRYSVVIPAYNSARTLAAAIESVLNQTEAAAEVIVIDDGSIDPTAKILKSFNSTLLRLVATAHAGPGSARNAGVRLARSDWVAFLDADDVWLPIHAATLRDLQRRHADAHLLSTRHHETFGLETPITSTEADSAQWSLLDFVNAPTISPIQTSSVAIRRTFFLELGGFASTFPGEDLDLWFRSLMVTPIAMSSQVTTQYVRHFDSIMAQTNDVVSRFLEQPVLASIESALADPLYISFRPTLTSFRQKLFVSFLRQAVAQSQIETSRRLISRMRSLRVPVPFLLAALSALPDFVLSLMNRTRQSVRGSMK